MESTNYRGVMRICLFLFGLILFACSDPSRDVIAEGETSASIFDIRYSRGLRIIESEHAYEVEIRNPADTLELLAEYAFPKNATDKQDQLPKKNLVLTSTTFSAYLDILNAEDHIAAMTYTKLIQDSSLIERVEKGLVKEVAESGSLDYELVLSLDPDGLITYNLDDPIQDKIAESGIPVFLNIEYLEPHPLGRLEWIKFMGLLVGEVDSAMAHFAKVEKTYNDLRVKAALKSSLPAVFTGSRYQEHWYAPGPNSYVATYIRHAGGNYSFSEMGDYGSLELDAETALKEMVKSDFWGLVVSDSGEFTMTDVLEMDPDYADLPAVKNGNVFVCNTGRVDYFGAGVTQPDVILADLIHIFHPDILPDHQPSYFRLVE